MGPKHVRQADNICRNGSMLSAVHCILLSQFVQFGHAVVTPISPIGIMPSNMARLVAGSKLAFSVRQGIVSLRPHTPVDTTIDDHRAHLRGTYNTLKDAGSGSVAL